MTATTASDITTACWAAPVHTAGAAALAIIGLAHLLVLHVFDGADPPAEEAIHALSRETTSPMFENGRQITVFDLNTGYSVGLGLFGILLGALMVVGRRAQPRLIDRWSPFNWICLTAGAGTFWISCLYFPEPVIALSGLAALCFATVLVAGCAPLSPGEADAAPSI